MNIDTAKMTDKALIKLCKFYGKNVLIWNRKFGSLLPEVYKRHLYKKCGFHSIHEFAERLTGMAYDTVNQILKLDVKLIDKPVLKALVQDVGWTKVRAVADIATAETQTLWAEKVKMLPKSSLELYVKNYKAEIERVKASEGGEGGDRLFDGDSNTCKSIPGNGLEPEVWTNLSFKVDFETEFRLRLLKQKIEKEKKEPVTFNQLMEYMLDEMGVEKDVQKSVQKGVEVASDEKKSGELDNKNEATRYIPANIRHALEDKYHHKCAYPGCNAPSKVLHHTERFAEARRHDEAKIVPLCARHHDIAHAGLIANELQESFGFGVNMGKPVLSWADRERQRYVNS